MSELSKLKDDISFLKNEIKELKSKACNAGVQSGGSSHIDNFDIDNDGEFNQHHDDVLGEDLPEGKMLAICIWSPGEDMLGKGPCTMT